MVGNADGTATGGRSTQRNEPDYRLLSLPPNFVGVLTGDSLLWQAVEPLAWNRTRVITGGAYRHRQPEDSAGLSKLMGKAANALGSFVPDFLPEDKTICERGQIAATGDFDPGTLVPMEHVVSDFHHFLNRQLHGVPAPPVRTAAQVGIAPPEG